MASWQSPGTTIGKGKAATAKLTGIPLDDLKGFIIIGISDDDHTVIIHSCSNYRMVTMSLIAQAHWVLSNHDLGEDLGKS